MEIEWDWKSRAQGNHFAMREASRVSNTRSLTPAPASSTQQSLHERAASLEIWREHGQPRWDGETGITDKKPMRHRIDRQGVSIEMQVKGVDHMVRISSILVHHGIAGQKVR